MRRTSADLRALLAIVPVNVVAECIRAAGKQSKRIRKLPEMVVFWVVLGMGLYRDLSVSNVLERVVDALGEPCRWGPAERPCKTSIAKARSRLGWLVVRTIFRRLAWHFADKYGHMDERWGLRVCTIDGTHARTADSKLNDALFGRPASTRGGRSAFPQLSAVMLVGAYTHLLDAVRFGAYAINEQRLAEKLFQSGAIQPGMLLLLDRAYFSFVWPARAQRLGADFVIRCAVGERVTKMKALRKLGSNDWLCELQNNGRKSHRGLPETVLVRRITRTRRGFKPIVVITSLLDPVKYPADEIFGLYKDRWEAETAYKELKVQLGVAKVPFRSKTPERVLQETYGLLLAYLCVRALMCEGAERADVLPTKLSFVDSLDRVRRAIGRLADRDWGGLQEELVVQISHCRLPARRVRSCPRAVKSLFIRYARKRSDGKTGRSRYQTQRAGAEARRAGAEAEHARQSRQPKRLGA